MVLIISVIKMRMFLLIIFIMMIRGVMIRGVMTIVVMIIVVRIKDKKSKNVFNSETIIKIEKILIENGQIQ